MLKINKGLVTTLIAMILSSFANAEFHGRIEKTPGLGDYQAYYDDVAHLTWLADSDGPNAMTWQEADDWAKGLVINGVTGWRLPLTQQPDATCSGYQVINDVDVYYGFNCTGSELGNMFYNLLGGVAYSGIYDTHNDNVYLFNFYDGRAGVRQDYYWSGTEFEAWAGKSWDFNFGTGNQTDYNQASLHYAWAVIPGDVALIENSGTHLKSLPVTISFLLF